MGIISNVKTIKCQVCITKFPSLRWSQSLMISSHWLSIQWDYVEYSLIQLAVWILWTPFKLSDTSLLTQVCLNNLLSGVKGHLRIDLHLNGINLQAIAEWNRGFSLFFGLTDELKNESQLISILWSKTWNNLIAQSCTIMHFEHDVIVYLLFTIFYW